MIALFVAMLLPMQDTVRPLVIRGAAVMDVRTGVVDTTTLIMQDGRIVARGRAVAIPTTATIIDGSGLTLLPGLIDGHVHLTLAGRARDNALKTLQAGVTTVADLGSANGGAVRVRELIRADSFPGPRVIAAGSWIGGRGGVCEFGGATIRGAEEARARAAQDIANGAQLLKVCITDWLAAAVARPDSVELTQRELQAVMTEAAGPQRRVVAHALNQAGVNAALAAGIGILAHMPVVDDATAAALARAGTCIATTMTTLLPGDATGALRASFERLRRHKVRLFAGTDAGVLPHGDNVRELLTLVSLGMSPLEAIQSATAGAGACLGLPSYGTLVVGTDADMVLVSGDPLRTPDVLLRPVLVVKSGRVVFRRE